MVTARASFDISRRPLFERITAARGDFSQRQGQLNFIDFIFSEVLMTRETITTRLRTHTQFLILNNAALADTRCFFDSFSP